MPADIAELVAIGSKNDESLLIGRPDGHERWNKPLIGRSDGHERGSNYLIGRPDGHERLFQNDKGSSEYDEHSEELIA